MKKPFYNLLDFYQGCYLGKILNCLNAKIKELWSKKLVQESKTTEDFHLWSLREAQQSMISYETVTQNKEHWTFLIWSRNKSLELEI